MKLTQVPGFSVVFAINIAKDCIGLLNEWEKCFHDLWSRLGGSVLVNVGTWYCVNCRVDRGLCSVPVLNGHKTI